MKRSLGFLVVAIALVVAVGGCSLMQYCPMHAAWNALTKSSKPAEAAPTPAPKQTAVQTQQIP
ncbi:MAG: hypothetical protein FJ291_19070 [Planctomycetes bacterium]|nr:hypothetical protein [Planctomycetota bacterium]